MTWWQRLLAGLLGRPTRPPTPPSTPPTRPPTPPSTPPTTADADPVADPTGFVVLLNAERARHGLRPVVADAELAAWAVRNNQVQATRGLEHWVTPPNFRRQNVGQGYPDASAVLAGWLASPKHRAGLLDPAITRAGCAHTVPYWTFNAASSS